MPRTFKDSLVSDLAVMLNADEFAESVTLRPATGSASTLTCIVDRSEQLNEGGGGLVVQHVADIEVARSAFTPAIGDAIILSGDTESQAYAFDSILEADEHSQTVRFVRNKPEQVGGGRQ